MDKENTAQPGNPQETLEQPKRKETAPKDADTVPQNDTEPSPETETKGAPRKSVTISVYSQPEAPTKLAKPTNCKECIIYTWKSIFNFFASDRIYGSVVGPHPTAFLFCCGCCYRRCSPACTLPFTYASISTKTQYFIMIIVTIIFSCLFIIPSPESDHLVNIANFFPCHEKHVTGIWGDCRGHGGYFMVYRNFFVLNFYFLCMAFTMIGVKSTAKNRFRKKMHHGFWLYKYLILVGLIFVSYLAIQVEGGGIFEMIMMSLGLVSTVFFSFVQLVLFLDLLELAAIRNQKRSKMNGKIVYGFGVGIVTIIILLILGSLCAFYTSSIPLHKYQDYIDSHDFNQKVFNDHGKLVSTNNEHCVLNILCITYLFVASIIILVITGVFRQRLPAGSWLGSLCVILYKILLMWSGLENQENFACRPFWRAWFAYRLNPGNKDTYFKLEGCFHGIAALLALYYYIFWHGPRTDTAPLSIAFVRVMNRCSKRSEVPVLSDNRPTKEHLAAQRKFKVWDDEQLGVTYSWSMFFVFLMAGSMTIMAAMTNFSNPWANLPMSSSVPAICVKISVSVLTMLCYIWPIVLPKSRCIRPDDDEI